MSKVEMPSLTGLISCFSRCYHLENLKCPIFIDKTSTVLLSKEEKEMISKQLIQGISFFNPTYKGKDEEKLAYIVNHQLAPSVLLRSAFAKEAFEFFYNKGGHQYLVFASGYDGVSLTCDHKDVLFFEFDKEDVIEDKCNRIKRAHLDYGRTIFKGVDFTNQDWENKAFTVPYNAKEKSFSTLLGISYYLSKEDFFLFLKKISLNGASESEIVFDYPTIHSGEEDEKNQLLAKGALETMKGQYSLEGIMNFCDQEGWVIENHLDFIEGTQKFFQEYNYLNSLNPLIAPKGVEYIHLRKL